MKEEKTFQKGDKVRWTYKHHLNSKSVTFVTKEGIFLRKIEKKYEPGRLLRPDLNRCLVQFKNNKYPSRVLVSEIEKIK